MIVNIYSMFDKKAIRYLPPFFMQTDGMAERGIFDNLRQPGAQDAELWVHASDFALHSIGTFDDETGEIQPMAPICVCEVVSVKEAVKRLHNEGGYS